MTEKKRKEINKFLEESNAIEQEYSKEALEDAIKAWEYAERLEFKPPYNISVKDILEIHKRLMKRLNPKIAGKIRQVNVWVGNRKCINPDKIKEKLRLLLNPGLFPYYLGEEQIKEWHIQFEKIHPFLDGNGRTGRILMNLQRIKLGLPLLIVHEGKEQSEYYKWFRD